MSNTSVLKREIVGIVRSIRLGRKDATEPRDGHRPTRLARGGSGESARSRSERPWLWPGGSPPLQLGTTSRGSLRSRSTFVHSVPESSQRDLSLLGHRDGIAYARFRHSFDCVPTCEWSVMWCALACRRVCGKRESKRCESRRDHVSCSGQSTVRVL